MHVIGKTSGMLRRGQIGLIGMGVERLGRVV